MYEAKDTVVLVTGGAAGIGAGVVEAFLDQGAKVSMKYNLILTEKDIDFIYSNQTIQYTKLIWNLPAISVSRR